MSEPVIRALTSDGLDDALRLSTMAGWNQHLEDWRMLLRLAPAGAFAAFTDAGIVGTAIGIDYGGFGWIAMMLVDPGYRGRGIGRRLLEAAIDAVPQHLPIRLDATPLGRPLYQRYGFEDESTLTRHVRHGSGVAAVADNARSAAGVRPLTSSDLELVIERDREIFGGSRETVLEWAFRGRPEYAHVARSDDGAVDYCLGRQGRLFDQIGPLVAAREDVANALADAALAAAASRAIAVDAFDSATGLSTALRQRGFVIHRPLIRMCRAATSASGPGTREQAARGQEGTCQRDSESRAEPRRSREFAIFGPEFA